MEEDNFPSLTHRGKMFFFKTIMIQYRSLLSESSDKYSYPQCLSERIITSELLHCPPVLLYLFRLAILI